MRLEAQWVILLVLRACVVGELNAETDLRRAWLSDILMSKSLYNSGFRCLRAEFPVMRGLRTLGEALN